jgi:hypothetical protein
MAARRRKGGAQSRHHSDGGGNQMVRFVPDVHRFVRREFRELSIGAAGAGVGFGYSFALDQLPNYTDFTNLFDSYRIDRVDAIILGSGNALQVYSAADYDDAVAPSGIADMLERQNVVVKTVTVNNPNGWRMSLVPRAPIEGAGGAGPQMSPVGTWVDCADASLQYFGLKFWIQPLTGTVALQPSLVLTYHLSFRAAK